MMSLQEMCDEGVRRAWLDADNKLRGSILADPAFSRKNTKDNTPVRGGGFASQRHTGRRDSRSQRAEEVKQSRGS